MMALTGDNDVSGLYCLSRCELALASIASSFLVLIPTALSLVLGLSENA